MLKTCVRLPLPHVCVVLPWFIPKKLQRVHLCFVNLTVSVTLQDSFDCVCVFPWKSGSHQNWLPDLELQACITITSCIFRPPCNREKEKLSQNAVLPANLEINKHYKTHIHFIFVTLSFAMKIHFILPAKLFRHFWTQSYTNEYACIAVGSRGAGGAAGWKKSLNSVNSVSCGSVVRP